MHSTRVSLKKSISLLLSLVMAAALCISASLPAKADDKLDELAQQIEQALDGWTVPDKKNAVLRFAETNTSHDIMGDKIYGAVQLRYTLTYMTETHHNHD